VSNFLRSLKSTNPPALRSTQRAVAIRAKKETERKGKCNSPYLQSINLTNCRAQTETQSYPGLINQINQWMRALKRNQKYPEYKSCQLKIVTFKVSVHSSLRTLCQFWMQNCIRANHLLSDWKQLHIVQLLSKSFMQIVIKTWNFPRSFYIS